MRSLRPLLLSALVLAACSPRAAQKPDQHPGLAASDRCPEPSAAGERFGNILVRDGGGNYTNMKTTVADGVHTQHVIVDDMPEVSLEVGELSIGEVDQGAANSAHAQAWKVLLSDGSAALGTAGNPVRVSPATSPANQPVVGAAANGSGVSGNPVLIAGSDGTNARSLSTDSSGRPVVAGAGTAGSPAGGVLSVQGVASGTALPVSDGGGSLTVDGTVAVSAISTSVTPGTSAANLGKAEDAAHSSGDVGVMALAVRRDTASSGASADGDYATLNVDSSGFLYTKDTHLDVAAPVGATITSANTSETTFSSQALKAPVTFTIARGFTGTLTIRIGTAGPVIAVLEWDNTDGQHNPTAVVNAANMNQLTYQTSSTGQTFRWHSGN